MEFKRYYTDLVNVPILSNLTSMEFKRINLNKNQMRYASNLTSMEFKRSNKITIITIMRYQILPVWNLNTSERKNRMNKWEIKSYQYGI